jgi:hypothetical protein
MAKWTSTTRFVAASLFAVWRRVHPLQYLEAISTASRVSTNSGIHKTKLVFGRESSAAALEKGPPKRQPSDLRLSCIFRKDYIIEDDEMGVYSTMNRRVHVPKHELALIAIKAQR